MSVPDGHLAVRALTFQVQDSFVLTGTTLHQRAYSFGGGVLVIHLNFVEQAGPRSITLEEF
jgi:hypothetical protein